MATTTNPSLTTSWTRIVASGDEFFLTLPTTARLDVFVATTLTDVAPSGVVGHLVPTESRSALSRSDIGPGYVWAKASSGCAASLNSWTP